MLRMPNSLARSGAASVLSLATRIAGSSTRAAAAYCGAIAWQGPHQGAQKSTTTGMSVFAMYFLKLAAVSSSGYPLNSG